MEVAVYGKNVEVTNALRQYITRKIEKIDRFFKGWDQTLSAHVTLSVERDRHIVEVTVPINGFILRGEDSSDNMYASVDLVVDKLEKQVTKYKARFNRKVAAGAAAAAGTAPTPAEDESPEMVVRTKRFAVKPQSVDEAIMQMNLLGHDFYVFANAETEEINVVYRRKDGAYGLIEPER